MKVCIVAPVHIYDDVRIFKKEAVSLSNKGYDVVLFARIDKERVVNGVHVKPFKYRSRLVRFIKIPGLFMAILREKADMYHLHNPDTIPLCFMLKILNKTVIYDTHENFKVRITNRTWIPKYLRSLVANTVDLLERFTSICVNRTIVTQEFQSQKFSKAVLINNAPIIDSRMMEEVVGMSKQIRDDTPVRLIYIGAVSEDRGAIKMVQLMEELNKSVNARLWLMGQAADSTVLEKLKSERGWSYVDYLGRLSQEVAFSYLVKSDVGLILLQNRKQYKDTSPNKLYEYQTFGVPYVASDYPSWKSQLEHVESGLFVDPSDIQQIASSIIYLINNSQVLEKMKNNGMCFVKEHFNWSLEEEKLYRVYDELKKTVR